MVEGVTEKFLDITMSGYEKTFGNELGPVIRGLFSDEPCIPSSGGVRWTPDLFEVFRKQWGYDLQLRCPCSPSKRATGNRYATTTSKR